MKRIREKLKKTLSRKEESLFMQITKARSFETNMQIRLREEISAIQIKVRVRN